MPGQILSMLDFAAISPCEYADGLGREQFVDFSIKALWPKMPRIAGPAFTVKCAPGDHLSLHAAIYEARPGDVIVVEADPRYAVAGGNVCAIAQQRGIAGFVVDGVIRDLAQVRESQFPVFARGVIPKPGAKTDIFPFNQSIICGGARVNSGDIIVADEEGIGVIPRAQMDAVYAIAKARRDKDAGMDLGQWRTEHQQKVASLVRKLR
ncbi:MAG: 4-hydroxy-4-methyl-2-oxoglutarate aldolase [Paraglaciecola sp.]|jgi:4-hydroxy-4-methyl-2-oxoglutarate aldolase